MFNEKQYRGKHSKYPKVICDVNEEDRLAIFSLSWGDAEANDLVINTIKDYYLSARTDSEQTSPFPLSKSLSMAANHLKIAVQLANDALYKEFNSEEYMALVEVMAIAINKREVVTAYAGGPNFLCKKRNSNLMSYIQNHHLGHEFGATKNYPLPSHFIGDDSKKEIGVQSFRLSSKDQFYFILCDNLPMIQASDDIDTIEKKVKLESERPYWLAQWTT